MSSTDTTLLKSRSTTAHEGRQGVDFDTHLETRALKPCFPLECRAKATFRTRSPAFERFLNDLYKGVFLMGARRQRAPRANWASSGSA